MNHFEKLMQDARSSHSRLVSDAMGNMMVILERYYLRRQNDPIYADMYEGLLGELAKCKFSGEEITEIETFLIDLLHADSSLQCDAARVLGKSSNLLTSVELIKCLENWRRNSDEFNVALLSALAGEHGFPYGGRYRWPHTIATTLTLSVEGRPEVRELAQRLIELYTVQFE